MIYRDEGKPIAQVIAYKHDDIVGRFSCKGFDTFGPFKLIGGVSKAHPDDKDLAEAVEFYNGLTEQPVFLNRETLAVCFLIIFLQFKIHINLITFTLLNTQIMLCDFIGRVIVDIHQQSRWRAVLPGVISKCLSKRVTADMFVLNCLLGSCSYNSSRFR